MAKTHMLKFRVSKQQSETIRIEAQAKGYVSIASYIRDLALNRNQLIETKIIETNQNVKKLLGLIENERNT